MTFSRIAQHNTTLRSLYARCWCLVEAVRSRLDKESIELRRLETATESVRSSLQANKAAAKRVDKDTLEAEEAKHQRVGTVIQMANISL